MEIRQQTHRAPEIYGDFWFNSDPIPLTALRGQVVCVHFWDYTSQACMNTLPYVKEWHRRYADKNLVVIGVHTPEFPFAADPFEVRKYVDKFRLNYPVVLDKDHSIWNSFRCRTYPSCFLIDKHGFVRYVQEGVGAYKDLEKAIQALVTESGYRAELPEIMAPLRDEDKHGAISYKTTPEILAGFQHRSIGNVEGFVPQCTTYFEDPGFYLEGRLYLQGNWFADREFLKLDDSEGDEGAVMFQYQAKEVNAVLKPEGEKNFQVFVFQDDAFLSLLNKGDDIRIDEEGRSFLLVNEPKLYNLVKNKAFGEHKLKLTSRSNGLALYSFSFVSSVIPEMISNN
jgi:peroxiredoxin